jgi:hypothetical protein
MSGYSARRSPYPFHIKIDGQGLLLGAPKPNQPVQLVSVAQQNISKITPTDFSYGGVSPLDEREEPYRSLARGMGVTYQETWEDGAYLSARGIDLSVWPWCCGPQLQLQHAPDATAAGDGRFFDFAGTVWRAQGSTLQRLETNGTWTTTATFAHPITCSIVFASNFDSQPRIFIGFDAGQPAQWSLNGTAFTPMSSFLAQAFAVVGREFWWATSGNRLRKCDTNADPTNEANFTTAQFEVGDATSNISNLLVSAGGTLIICKTDGLYTLNATGDSFNLFPYLKFAPVPHNGKWAGQFLNSLFVSYGNSLLRINSDLSVDSIGLDKLTSNTSEVRGPVTAFAGIGTYFAWAMVWNPDTSQAFLCKLGTFEGSGGLAVKTLSGTTSTSTNLELQSQDAWHGSLSDPLSSLGCHLFTSYVGAPPDHTRTYLSLQDGSIYSWVNACGPNPANCSQYRFVTGDHWVDLPQWNGGFAVSNKDLRRAIMTATRLDAQNYLTLDYAMSSAGAFTSMPEHFDSIDWETVSFPNNLPFVVNARFRVHIHNPLATTCPLVSSFAIGYSLHPLRIMQFTADVLCADGLVRRDGVMLRIGRKKIQALIERVVDQPGAVEVTLPDEKTQMMSFTDLQEVKSWDEIGRSWRGSLRVTCNQWEPAA